MSRAGASHEPDRYLTLKQLVTFSDLSIGTLRRRLRDRRRPLPHRRVGRRILVLKSAFEAWLATLTKSGPG